MLKSSVICYICEQNLISSSGSSFKKGNEDIFTFLTFMAYDIKKFWTIKFLLKALLRREI